MSINPNIQKRLIEKRISNFLKINESKFSEKLQNKEYINDLLYPAYDLNLILEPETPLAGVKEKSNLPPSFPFPKCKHFIFFFKDKFS